MKSNTLIKEIAELLIEKDIKIQQLLDENADLLWKLAQYEQEQG